MQYCITEDGVRIAYTDHGEGPAVLFIPYFAESFSMQEVVEEELLAFYDRLGAGRRIIRYDGRGTGLSEREVEDFSHEAMLRDLEAVVQALGVREFALWGQTLGGPRAIEFAAGHPEMVTRLILVATFPKGADVMAKDQLDSLAALARTNWEMASQLFADMVGRETSEANARRGALFRESTSGEAVARMLESLYETDVTPLLPEVKAPTLVLQRTNDALFRFQLGETMADQIPNATLVPLEGESVLYDPRDVGAGGQAVEAFLKEMSAA